MTKEVYRYFMKIPKEMREKQKLGTYENNKMCSVFECEGTAIRSLSEKEWMKYIDLVGLKVGKSKNRKVYLCKKHFAPCDKERKKFLKTTKQSWKMNERSYSNTIRQEIKPHKNFKR